MLPNFKPAYLLDDSEEERSNKEMFICYLCKEKYEDLYDDITFNNDDFLLCYRCYHDIGHKCDTCNKEMKDYEELKFLCDTYDNINDCSLCILKRYEEDNLFVSSFQQTIDKLRKKIINLEKELEENLKINNECKCFEKTTISLKDNYIDFILAVDNEILKKRIKDKFENTLRKNTIKSKCISIFKEDKSRFIELKKERDIKLEMFKKNIIKSKVLNSLRNLSENKNNIDKIIKTVKKYKNRLKFDDLELQNCALDNNRTKINFFSILYEKKEINKTISDRDFKLAVEEYHSDKNITRITKISKTCYYLRNNNIIWNSDVIFKSLYIFQYLEDYQFNYLITEIEKICIN